MDIDVAIIGAGFGGLGCAMGLIERGRTPVVFEALKYPGGCASTFSRDGHRFESGATLFSGLDEHGLFGRWIRRHALAVETRLLDPVIELRLDGDAPLPVWSDRERFVRELAARSDRPDAVKAFFAYQRRVADVLWELFAAPDLLPPFDLRMLLRHAARSPRYLPLVRIVGQPLSRVLRRFGLEASEPLRSFLRALCQITVQCDAEQAEAAFALAAIDYPWRGTGHVVGGIGELATGLAHAITAKGGDVRYAHAIRRVTREGNRFSLESTRGRFTARNVVMNVLPAQASRLLGEAVAPELEAAVSSGWSACMLYRAMRPSNGLTRAPLHLELVADRSKPFTDGNHVFVSISGANEPGKEGLRTATVSTHVRPGLGAEDVERVQTRMRETLRLRAPEWCDVEHELPASPRTFERFTRRGAGLVGGVPRTAGLHNYRTLSPTRERGVWLVGDSVFPGQSILATALGGERTAEAICRS